MISSQNQIDQLVAQTAPSKVVTHPGMISRAERNFLFNLVKDHHQPGQTIVDAGIFLGASTKAFCTALASRDISDDVIHSFEYAVFNEKTAQNASQMLRRDLDEGQDFSGILRELFEREKDLIEFHFGDICKADTNFENPSVMFLDVIKSAQIANRIAQSFFPKLNKETLVLHQDYFHPAHPWITYMMGALADQFEYVGKPEKRKRINTAVFKLSKPEFEPCTIDFDADRETALKYMDRAVDFHTDPVERYLATGCRAVVQAIHDKDPDGAMNDMLGRLAGEGLAGLAVEGINELHTKRIRNAVRRYATGDRAWL